MAGQQYDTGVLLSKAKIKELSLMEELQSQELEGLVEELEEEYGARETPQPEVEELLQILQSSSLYLARQDAAKQLGKVGTSNSHIIQALTAAEQSDSYPEVRRAATASLRTPVHQEFVQQHPDLLKEAGTALQQAPAEDTKTSATGKALLPVETHAKMLKEVRSWGLWLLGIGVLSLFVSGLSGAWGIVLLVAGLASFLFREAAMFVVYGIILTWAGISNLLAGQLGWIVFALFQFVLAFSVFKKYTQFRRAEAGLDSPPGPQRASRAFPQIGCALGGLAFLGLVFIFFAGAVFIGATGSADVPPLLGWLESLVVGLAVLGLAVAVASLLSGYRHKVMAVLGIVGSALVLLPELFFALLS